MRGPEPHHRLQVEATLGGLSLHARLEFAAPWTVIFGPSGSGKSSLLRAMCGLLDASQVEFAERAPSKLKTGKLATGKLATESETTAASNSDPNSNPNSAADSAHCGQLDHAWIEIDSPRLHTPPHLRGLAYAPQGAAIFPHLTVREHIAFPLQNSRARPTDTPIIDAALDLFDLTALANRRPRQLSGGERQRVNLARAFAVPNPRLMLLDEPFTGIDRATRDALLPLMRARLAAANVPVISVTHDVEEALLLDAEVVRLDSGRVLDQGPARVILAAERQRMLHALGSTGDA